MDGWEKFGKYIGIQGVLAVGLTCASVAMIFLKIDVPKELWGLMGVSWGFFFAKNGGNYVSAVKPK
jgi:hypothetical protein